MTKLLNGYELRIHQVQKTDGKRTEKDYLRLSGVLNIPREPITCLNANPMKPLRLMLGIWFFGFAIYCFAEIYQYNLTFLASLALSVIPGIFGAIGLNLISENQ